MSYQIIQQPVANSKQLYLGIRCLKCGGTSYSQEDIDTKRCPFCDASHDEESAETGEYKLMKGKTKKSKKLHWSWSGKIALCMNQVSVEVDIEPHARFMCINCEDLKRRGFKR